MASLPEHGLPVVVALGPVDPALVSGREPQAVANPAWRTHCTALAAPKEVQL